MWKQHRAAVAALKPVIAGVRARARHGPKATIPPLEQSTRDLIARRLTVQWNDVIEPMLREIKAEFAKAGYKVQIGAPSETTDGSFEIEGQEREGWWNPGFRLSPSADGTAIRLNATFGEATNNPLSVRYQPEELSSEVVGALVTRIIEEGM